MRDDDDLDLTPRLLDDGLLVMRDSNLRTTRRWQGAVARVVLQLLEDRAPGDDLRVPIAAALIQLYGDVLDNDSLVNATAIMLRVELEELAAATTGFARRHVTTSTPR